MGKTVFDLNSIKNNFLGSISLFLALKKQRIHSLLLQASKTSFKNFWADFRATVNHATS